MSVVIVAASGDTRRKLDRSHHDTWTGAQFDGPGMFLYCRPKTPSSLFGLGVHG